MRGKLPGTLAVLAVLSPCSIKSFYHLSTLNVTHVRKHTRPSAFFRATESGARAWDEATWVYYLVIAVLSDYVCTVLLYTRTGLYMYCR